MPAAARLLAAALCLSQAVPAPGQTASTPIAEILSVRFYSDPLLNLHHTLYAAAWAGRPEAGTLRALAGALPAPLDAPMTSEERSAWNAALDYYDKQVAARHLLFGRGMVALKDALVAGNLESDAVGAELRAVLESVLPIYRRHFWPAHDRVNRDWIASAVDRLTRVGPEVTARLEKLYGVPWFSTPVRADIVWIASREGAYTTVDPTHATISSERAHSEWSAVEIVFHELSHVLVLPIQGRIREALGERIREHATLWHAIQFYVTGAVVQQVLKAQGIAYTPYLYQGLFDRAWPQYRKPVEANWEPYVQGKVTLDAAIDGTVKMLGTAK